MGFWLWACLRLVPLLLVSAIVGIIFDAKAGIVVFLAGLSLGHIFHLVQLARFIHWLKLNDLKTLAAEVPESRGAWGDAFASLYYLRRNEALTQEKMSHSLEQFRQAAEVIPDGIVLMDDNLRIDWNNVAATRYLAISHERDRGLSIMDLVRDPKFGEYVRSADRAAAVSIRTATEPVRSLSILMRPFGNHQHILICKDITAIEQVDIMRRDFVANVSHEMKTPLTVIIGFLEGLIDNEQPVRAEDVVRQCTLMQEQALRMDRLVSDLLTLSKLEEAGVPQKQEKVDVPVLIEALLDEARALSNGRHVLSADIAWSVFLRGSWDELHSAFSNLISNAIRYSPDGGTITVRWHLKNNHPVFEVQDSGIGIAPEHLSRLTERFYRVDKSRSSATGGTGLGLAIVKHVLLRHQARLEIESRLGAGSTFRAVFAAPVLVA